MTPSPFVRKINAIGTRRRVVKTLGSIVLLKAMAERMNLRGIIDTLIPMERDVGLTHGEVVEALVINRCHAPAPLYEVGRWANQSGAADLYAIEAEAFNDDRLRATLDVLPQYEEAIQSALAVRLVGEFAVPTEEVLYDLTSLYFEGDYDKSELVEFGYSRDQKPDKKQVNVGLTTSRKGGVPLRSETLKGSTGDPTTVEANVRSLRQVLRRKRFLQITDGGMLTPATVHQIEKEGDLEFLGPWQAETALINRLQENPGSWEELTYEPAKGTDRYWVHDTRIDVVFKEEHLDQPPPPRKPGQRGRQRKHPVTYHTHTERALIVRSEKKQAVDTKTRAKHLVKLETELNKMQGGLNTRRLKTRAQVEAKMERLFSGPFAVYKPCFSIDLQGEDLKMTLAWSYNDEALEALRFRDGIYVLLTNRMDVGQYPPQWVLERYKERNAVEARIRDLKSRLRVRPLFVHTDPRIEALVLITVIALQMYSLIEWEATKAQEKWTALILKREFAGVSILQTHNADGSIELEWCNVLPHHLRILEQLGLTLLELPDRLEAFT